MNEPIISPWLIYLAGRIDLIQGFCCIIGFIVTIFAVIVTIAVVTDDTDEVTIKIAEILVCMALVLDMLAVFLPTKTEIYAMYTAEHITPANIKATGEFTDKAVDKLIEKILKASETVKE